MPSTFLKITINNLVGELRSEPKEREIETRITGLNIDFDIISPSLIDKARLQLGFLVESYKWCLTVCDLWVYSNALFDGAPIAQKLATDESKTWSLSSKSKKPARGQRTPMRQVVIGRGCWSRLLLLRINVSSCYVFVCHI